MWRVLVIYIWDKDFVKTCNMEEMLQRGNDGDTVYHLKIRSMKG